MCYQCETERGLSLFFDFCFSVGEDFSFDDAVARRYGCEVHSFDPRSVLLCVCVCVCVCVYVCVCVCVCV